MSNDEKNPTEEAALKVPRRLKRVQMKGTGSYTPPPPPLPVNRTTDPKE